MAGDPQLFLFSGLSFQRCLFFCAWARSWISSSCDLSVACLGGKMFFEHRCLQASAKLTVHFSLCKAGAFVFEFRVRYRRLFGHVFVWALRRTFTCWMPFCCRSRGSSISSCKGQAIVRDVQEWDVHARTALLNVWALRTLRLPTSQQRPATGSSPVLRHQSTSAFFSWYRRCRIISGGLFVCTCVYTYICIQKPQAIVMVCMDSSWVFSLNQFILPELQK